MHDTSPGPHDGVLGEVVALPCGLSLKNRLAKAAMSDSLGDGAGNPTSEQIELYRRWAEGGTALSLIGEVQIDHRYPEKPGNLVLGPQADPTLLGQLADAGNAGGAQVWPQLGHAGALAYAPVSNPAGPSELDVGGLRCAALSTEELASLPASFARAAVQAQSAGFMGVQVHAGHGFLLSQFLSPLFNRRTDRYGGSAEARSLLLLEVVRAVRRAVGSEFAIGVKINSSDQLDGGLTEDDALIALGLLDGEAVDLIDISGGTYFPGAPASSDRRSSGPYFVDFALRARTVTSIPLMVTGGFKTRAEAIDAVERGAADVIGLARTMALDPELPSHWLMGEGHDPEFPSFESPPEGAITAWFTMRLDAIARGTDGGFAPTLEDALADYERRDAERTSVWSAAFDVAGPAS